MIPALATAPNSAVPLAALKKRRAEDARIKAAGLMIVTPDDHALFLRRSVNAGDKSGFWAFPGGGVEAGEDPETTAIRECREETEYIPEGPLKQVDHTVENGVDFTTFSVSVNNQFIPTLDYEHDSYAWAPLDNPPQPLHPGVAKTLAQDEGDFKEEDHPRKDDGKFGKGSGGSGGSSGKLSKEPPPKPPHGEAPYVKEVKGYSDEHLEDTLKEAEEKSDDAGWEWMAASAKFILEHRNWERQNSVKKLTYAPTESKEDYEQLKQRETERKAEEKAAIKERQKEDRKLRNLSKGMPKPTAEQKQALIEYTEGMEYGERGGYEAINKSLRKGRPNEDAKAIQSYLDKCFTNEDMVVYRGIGGGFAKKLIEKIKAGISEFVEPGFLSTSIDSYETDTFGPVMFEINVPKGSKGTPLYNLGPTNKNTKELEFLFQAGSKLKILSMEGGKIKAELIQNETTGDEAVFDEAWPTRDQEMDKHYTVQLGRDNGIAFDESVRSYSPDGHLHISVANISKATVNPYYGWEIPDWQKLGLDPDKVYKMFRDPKELEKGAESFNGKPLLIHHKPATAEEHPEDLVIGAIGSDVRFEDPYLKASLTIWPEHAIEAVESGDQKELSAGYRYTADMTPGEYEGESFDGRMVSIVGNHLSLVETGRAGPEVAVGDSQINNEVTWLRVEKAIRALLP